MGAKLPAIPPQWNTDEGQVQGWSPDGILGGIDPSMHSGSGFLLLDDPTDLESIPQTVRGDITPTIPLVAEPAKSLSDPESHHVLWRQLGLGAAKAAGGGLSVAAGGELCATGLGCVAGAPLAATGLSDGWQGATMMWDAVHGRPSQGTNYLKDWAQTANPKWGGFVYDTVPLVTGAGGLYARVPAIVDPALTGINTTRSLFGVTVPRMDRATNIFGHIFDSRTTKALLGASMMKKAYDAYQDYPAD